MDSTAPALVFSGRKQGGRLAVTGSQGAPVAFVSVKRHRAGFTATAADGSSLCEASINRHGLSSTWTATGPEGRDLLTARWTWFGNRARVTTAAGDKVVLRAGAWGRSFTVAHGDGRQVLRATPRTSWFRRGQSDVVVLQDEALLDLAGVVALVQIWRLNEEAASPVFT